MTVNDARMRVLIKSAPQSLSDFISLLDEGLDWPIYDTELEPEELLLDWSPEELHLDPAQVARLVGISQIPPLTSKQKFGAFYLRFEGGQLPIGAIRRLVQRLVTSKRGRGSGKAPSWDLDDLIFFCSSGGANKALHVVNFHEEDGVRVLRVLSWSDNPTETRLKLLMQRALAELRWVGDEGPKLVVEPNAASGFTAYREGIRSAKILSRRMAEVAQDVRNEVKALISVETESGPMRSLYKDVRERLIGDISAENFADVYAQTMVYGLLTARIAHPEQFKSERSLAVIRFDNEFLDAIYARFRDEGDGVIDVDELGLADLAKQLAETDIDELLADFGADNQRDDPVVYFYEEFLAQYDAQQRKDLGAFYTPKPVVRYIVKTVDDALKSFGLPLGVADPTTWSDYVKAHPGIEAPANVNLTDSVVSMFDPANGTGTFLVEWLAQAKKNAGSRGLETALHQASALEISLASYAVSHLKVSLELPEGLREKERLPIFLGDTLGPRRVARLKSMEDPVGVEGVLANEVKYDRHHNVLIGNPPYDRVESTGTGGFVRAPKPGSSKSLFDDIFDDAKKHVIFSSHASLYNLYVYFWRWGIWKVFEENTGPAIISMITASSWLDGPGFLGLRRLAREVADEIIVLDLHGDNKGTRKDENVFDIESPVAIVTLVRRGKADRSTPSPVRYASIRGTRGEKLEMLASLAAGDAELKTTDATDAWHGSFIPAAGGPEWASYPALTDLFPWQQPGMMINRTWPVAPDRDTLLRRWEALVSTAVPTERREAFATSKTGRGIATKIAGMVPLVELTSKAPANPVTRTALRSFDRQWILNDPRLIALERPALWAALSENQVFLTTMTTTSLGAGPAATLATAVPDKHYFSGRGGKDIFPLYRDAKGMPNVDPKLLAALTEGHQRQVPSASAVTHERLFAYTFGVLAGTDYTTRFHKALETAGPRVVLTRDPELFDRMATHGAKLIWLQTFGERFTDGQGGLPLAGVTWRSEPSRLPADKKEISYDASTGELHVADGVLIGVSPEVYSFEVSGMGVIPKWLGYRMTKPAGRAASSKSPLDKIRPESWSPEWSRELIEIVAVLKETLAVVPAGIAILDQILRGPIVLATEIPEPPVWMRQAPSATDEVNALFSDEGLT
ncbi:type ISP restriction/modification enzyme [Salinibacterium sp. SWN167]|uniref:type ISP restriction/modification enzyme n=1 Tax=Salinibacterium sp. SWN167 TaxID=2792054 RepID=UPI0018CEA9CF|nr:type ISP restriction/modification enzyme [Salinibacterium sp. SWN167]MBH0081958.1 N-6 DNA methylase [Salinibacterium sp. SWN167]